jgi:ribonucleotide reductase alpha subunit
VSYIKSTNVAGDLEVFSPLFLEYIKGYNIPAETLASVAEKGSCQGVEGIPGEVAVIFKGAREIAPIDHLLMQAAVQKCGQLGLQDNKPPGGSLRRGYRPLF